MSANLKDIIKQEFIKCAKDPVYFMKKYYTIQHPKRGRIKFNLYPFQETVLGHMDNEDYMIINKSRQLGISTLCSAYSLWMMLFHKDKNVLCIATKQETAKNMVTKVRFAYDNLPQWLRIKTVEHNKLSLRLANGSQIKATSASSDAGRSEAVSLLLIDEAAFIDNIDEIFASAQQTLATGGGCIALSTPYGTGNWFHSTWVKAEARENTFLPIRLPWTVHPERNEEWRDEQDIILGPRMAAQECDCDFSTSGDTVIEPDILNFYEKTYIKDPSERRGIDGNLWIYEIPDYSKTYTVVADVARGDGKDYSAFHVFDIDNAVQVAEYKAQIGTKDYANVLFAVATEYNDALLVVENANVGWAVIQQLIDRGYRNLYYSPKMDTALSNADQYLNKYENGNAMVPGFTTSLKTRPLVISKMVSYIHEKSVIIQSKRLIEELRTFVWKNGKAQALGGYNDDLVMAFGIAMFLRDTALHFRQQGVDMARAALGGIHSTNHQAPNIYTNSNRVKNPYEMENPYGGKEDISWLLG
tara:strand:+ start:351 stop:1934 length:1584 start_codon:yes stop_codon:yes gene_type:complete